MTLSILDAAADRNLFAPWFAKRPASWAAWRAFLAALFGLPMTADQAAIYRQCTGRNDPPAQAASEAWLVIGRRGGKSFIMALCAVYLACFRDHREHLAPGEKGTVLVIARDRKQARVIVRYIRALLTEVPMLARMVQREWAEGFDLSNSVTIEVGTASFRSVRGYTLVACLLDELAFWPTDDSAEPDYEIINAIRPGMATIPGAMLLAASSPYARRGSLWDAHRSHYGKEGDPVLVWQAATRTMNPSVPEAVINVAMQRDPANASAEYLAQFRSDLEALLGREAVAACVTPDMRERPRISGTRYQAFVDPSGGSADSMALAIGHKEGDTAVLDAVRERKPPFSPDTVVTEFATLLKAYGISTVTGDRYAGVWPVERFRVHHIKYEQSAKPKSDLYRDILPAINSGKVDLLDNDRLINQLIGLERRTSRGGRDLIDHPPNSHDDLANVVAGVVAALSAKPYGGYDVSMRWVGEVSNENWRASRLQTFIHSGGRYR